MSKLATTKLINQKINELLEQKALLQQDAKTTEAAVLMEFLTKIKQKKHQTLEKINSDVTQIQSDLEKASEQYQDSLKENVNDDESHPHPAKRLQLSNEGSSSQASQGQTAPISEDRRRKIDSQIQDLESLYFSYKQLQEEDEGLDQFGKKLYQVTGANVFREVASIKLPEPITGSNIVSSVEFDASGVLFAAAGVTKRIKVFNYEQIENQQYSGIYPIQEIETPSKISCISWNPYVQYQIATADYNGVVAVYDAVTGNRVYRFEEHQNRTWSIDFSKTDPSRLISGSDDHHLKIWSLNCKNSVCSIDGKTNICSVQFSPTSSNTIAFGSADHSVHIYDLRNLNERFSVLNGHTRAVSYVRFLSEKEIISASTDCSLRLWRLGDASSEDATVIPGTQTTTPLSTRTYRGHLNEKNFVGLSVSGDLIACGSENNSLYTYHRDIEHPLSCFRFPNYCPRTGREVDYEQSPFVSSLAWRQDTNRLVAANSNGIIKLLDYQI